MASPSRSVSPAAEWLLAAVVGGLLLVVANWLVPAAAAPFPGHGERFAAMAADPFAFAGEFPQRVLWPLLAWLFAQLGVSPVRFSGLCSAALLAVVFWSARRRTGAALPALLVAAAVAASGAVLVYQPMRCFSDPLSLLLLVLAMHFAARRYVFWGLVLLTAFSHELVFFFSPWLVYLRRCNGGALRAELLQWAAAVGVYGAFRLVLKASGHVGPYDVGYYLDNAIWVPFGLPAIWLLWGFVVLVEFGPLLIAIVYAGRRGELAQPAAMGGRWWPWLFWPSLLLLMVLAYDVMRFAPLVLLPLLPALVAMARTPFGRRALMVLLVCQVSCYLWLHPMASEQGGRHFTEISGQVLQHLGLLASRTLADAVQFTAELLATFWHYALVALGSLVGVVVVGHALARRAYADGDRPPAAAPPTP